ncbi:MAG TPA: aldo/keto reductase [Steroidobacter sp.]|jgi:diketogulonate reductase-like aldo/keto reductase|nr:aldo/keto reductase [Steroidobacteraceae bacterium]HLS81791.1 aldo/keto reductase [Steroidobacter sp.]
MLQRPVPSSSSGESLPVIGMGTWNTFDVGESPRDRAPLVEVLEAFYGAGASLIDSSPMYGAAERVTGDLVAQLGRQDATFYATKVWTRGRDRGVAQIEQSLRALRTPRLDLLQIHNLLDWRAHAATLRRLQRDGVVRYTGVTHYTVDAHDDLESVLRAQSFDFAQFNYSIATRAAERRLMPFCQERGVAVIVNRPFEEGALFTRVRGRKLPGYAAEIGCTSWAQFFLKFIISHPAVTCVIPATSRVAHMRDNLQAGFGALPDARLRERMAKDFAS